MDGRTRRVGTERTHFIRYAMTTQDFNGYVSDLINKGGKQVIIRSTNDIAWKSGLAEYLLNKFETRQISFDPDCSDFVAYILRPLPIVKTPAP